MASYLWLDVLEVDINVGYCKHLTVRISIRRQPNAQAPRESEEGDVAPHFLPTHLARSASSSTRSQRGDSMHSSERYVSARNADESSRKRQRYPPDDICPLVSRSTDRLGKKSE